MLLITNCDFQQSSIIIGDAVVDVLSADQLLDPSVIMRIEKEQEGEGTKPPPRPIH